MGINEFIVIILCIYILVKIFNRNFQKKQHQHIMYNKPKEETKTYQNNENFDFIAPSCDPCKKSNLLTEHEYKFFKLLMPYCDCKGWRICPKVRMEDFIKAPDWYRGYIKSRHVDFLICDHMLHILGIIELNGIEHQNEKQKKIDAWEERLLKNIGIEPYWIPDRYNDLKNNQITDQEYHNFYIEILNNVINDIEEKNEYIVYKKQSI